MTTPTAEQRAARQQGRLDQRCRDCGSTTAASSWCCTCGGRDLEYRIHVKGETQWCRQVSGAAIRVVQNPSGSRRRIAEPPLEAVAPMSGCIPTSEGPEGALGGSTR